MKKYFLFDRITGNSYEEFDLPVEAAIRLEQQLDESDFAIYEKLIEEPVPEQKV